MTKSKQKSSGTTLRKSNDGRENKCVQVKSFREKLHSTYRHAIFVESIYNDTRGSMFDRVDTENIKQAGLPKRINPTKHGHDFDR